MKRKISVIFGTRPEAIKLAPVILKLRNHPEIECHICSTAQHREMLNQVFSAFEIAPDTDLGLMQPNQSLSELTVRCIAALDYHLRTHKPDIVLVQGDTTTVLCAALTAFYNRIPVGHVEAGLRTWRKDSPFPEETNRVLTTHLADIHFAPTETNRANLEREGVPSGIIHVTGNTIVDALLLALEKIKHSPPSISSLPDFLQPDTEVTDPSLILITGHRRENFGEGFKRICLSIRKLAEEFPKVHFVYPVHLNPNVHEPVHRIIGKGRLPNIHLIEPLPYLPLIGLMKRSHLIMTDSGGIQEEAPSLGKPVLVMREATERPEAIQAGVAKLVGTDVDRIVGEVERLLYDDRAYRSMARRQNPFGDGQASERIVQQLAAHMTQGEG